MKNVSIVITLMIFTLLQSCLKDPIAPTTDQVAPTLPPIETFVMSFDGFADVDTPGISSTDIEIRNQTTFHNWFFAATNVVVWNVATAIHMAIPVAAFAESFKHDASFEGNGLWLWSYNYSDKGKTYSAELTGQVISEQEVQWDMYISQQNGFSKVHWFSGQTNSDGGGSWSLNYLPENPTPYLTIDYQANQSNGNFDIKYTNVNPNSADRGDYISYGHTNEGDQGINRSYEVFQASKDNALYIEWNDPSRAGRVKNLDFFGDSNWHCWDQQLMDIDCQ